MRTWKLVHLVVVAAALIIGLAGGLTVAFASGGFERPTEINRGLINAANSVLQNLLGSDVASVRFFNPQPDPPRVMVHVNGEAAIPTDLVFFLPPGPVRSTCQNVARVSVAGGVITLTRDTNAALELETAELNLGALPPGPSCGATEIP